MAGACAGTACLALVGTSVPDEATAGERLLHDLLDLWGDAEHHFTETLLERLHTINEAPWADWYGKPLAARGLARLLRPYGVTSKNVRIGDAQAKG